MWKLHSIYTVCLQIINNYHIYCCYVVVCLSEYENVLQELEIARKKLSESEAEIRQCVISEENKMKEEIEKV